MDGRMTFIPQGPAAIVVDGNPVVYRRDGSGRPLIFVHGMISDQDIWDVHVPSIAKRYEVIRPTLGYFGASPWRDDGKGFSVDALADELGALIKSCDLGPATLVGWSFGGAVCLSLAARMPQLVGEMLLYEPSLAAAVTEPSEQQIIQSSRGDMFEAARSYFEADEMERAVKAFIDGVNGLEGSFEALPEQVRQILQRNVRVMDPFFAGPPAPSVTLADLEAMTQKVTLMLGEDTSPFWQITLPALARALPNAELLQISNARHMWPVESPDNFVEAVMNGLD
jgi:pimeloyl-ACP methyl ester carboxylesterase